MQLILGKTLERRLGREAAVRLFKSLRVGQAVEVTGRPQAHPDPAAGMKRTVATLDVVVHDIRVVSEAALRTDSEGEGQVGPNGACLESMPEDSISTAPNTGLPMEQVSREVERTQFRAKAVLETSLGPVYTKNVERVHIVAGLPGIELMRRALLSPPVASTTAPALTATEDRSAPVHSDPAEGGSLPDSATTSGDSEQRQRNRGRHHRRAAAMVPTGWRPRVVLGMDCEWQPSSRAEPNTPVSVLQIGSTHDVFLIDLLALCAAGRPAEGAALPAEQEALSEVLAAVFADKDIVKVGFGLRYDLERLVESYPWLPCFGGLTAQHCATAETLHASTASTDTVENGVMPDCSSSSVVPSAVSSVPFASHVDLRLLARAAGDGHTSFKRMGLAQLCHHVLGVHLDKGEQRSDWGNRPLSQEQVDYAAADVCCLVDMFNVIIARRTDLLASYWMDQFAGENPNLCLLLSHAPYHTKGSQRFI